MQGVSKKYSLRDNVRLRILQDMLAGLKENFTRVSSFIMVVDDMTVRIMSACAKMIELLERGVLSIEKLDLERKPLPKMHAIYFVAPTETSVSYILKDFEKAPIYGNVHIFFTNRCDNNLVEKISKCKLLIQRILTFKEINLDFLCPEQNVFHFDLPEALPILFGRKDSPQAREMEEKIAYKLSTIIPTLFYYEKFQIIYNKNSSNPVSEKVANILKQRIDRFLQLRKTEKEEEVPAPVKIVILDRTYDPLTPLLHDYYYMSLVYDLLEVKENLVEYPTQDKTGGTIMKKAFLNDEDDIWVRYKYHHIAEALEKINAEFHQFVETNKTVAFQKEGGSADLNTMEEIVKKFPLYKDLVDKYTLHLSLIEGCLKVFNEIQLKEVGEIEQSLATGIDNNGESIKAQKLLDNLAQRLAQSDIDQSQKLRLILIALASLELAEKDKNSLMQFLDSKSKVTVNGISNLGVEATKNNLSKNKTNEIATLITNSAKAKLKATSFDLCRYSPLLEFLAPQFITNKFEKDKYGTINIPSNYDGSFGQATKANTANVSLRKGLTKPNANNTFDNVDEAKIPKIIFFIIGGISCAEMRVIHEFENNYPDLAVITGSTSMIKPKEYMDRIASMTGS